MKEHKNKPADSGNKNTLKGIISVTATGLGFVTSPDLGEDVFIERQFLNTALHGDEVEFCLFAAPRHGAKCEHGKDEKPTGEVVKVLKRAKSEFVGTVDKKKGSAVAFVIPDDKRMYTDIFIAPNESKKMHDGYKVLTRIVKWDNAKKNPEGRILKVIGKKGDNNVEMESIVIEKGFETGFPAKVEKEAEYMKRRAKQTAQKEIEIRRDFRDVVTFTIDPEDAKDFDDAISFRKVDGRDDLFEIGVHIADVSHYVCEGGELDKEAIRRGVSIYLVDRTIPMLPEVLSNDICSLNPNEDKMTYSAVLTMTSAGDIKNVWLGRTVINSNKRFVYEEAQKVLDEKSGPYHYELDCLNKIAKIFREERKRAGSLDFEKEEVKFKLDARGKPLDVIEKPRLDVHKLVEEFMILANREVAAYLNAEIKKIKKGASVYRVHGTPKKAAADELLVFLRVLGHDIETKGEHISSKELNEIFEKIKDSPEEALIKTVAMRTMAKAIYSVENVGHYGLALENYTHFTSPIRRYADLLVHRILEKHLHGKHLDEKEIAWHHELAMRLSAREIDAVDAERDSIAYKQVQYMMDKVGNVYEGVISGVTKWGAYVEESRTKASGMVRLKDMADDYYIFNPETYSLVGEKTKKKYSVGDVVKIKIVACDLEKRTIDYEFVS